MSLLDERIKRASKTRPPVSAVKPSVCSPVKRPAQLDPPQASNNTYICNSEDEMPTDDDVDDDEDVNLQSTPPNVSPLNENHSSR